MKGLPRSLYQAVVQGVIDPDNGEEGGGETPADPPTVVDTPQVTQNGANLNCTMGNWEGEPTSRTYQWQKDGADVADATSENLAITQADVGKSFTCIQTATNAAGTSEPVTSNPWIVIDPGASGEGDD